MVRAATALLASFAFSVVAFAQTTVFAPEGAQADPKFVPTQSRGVDQSVDYASLLEFGPWDDRNYQLTKNDLALLPSKDRYIPEVPAFFKVLKRREMAAEGFPLGKYYPREVNKEFSMRFGGLIQDGTHYLTSRGRAQWSGSPFRDSLRNDRVIATDPIRRPFAPVLGQGPFDGTISNNETTLEFAPHDPNLVIAGSNGTGDQRVAMSTDGGVTWTRQAFFTGTCCDPAHDWQQDGSVVYAASLTSSGTGGCAFNLCTGVYWSFNNGQNWNGPVNVSTASSDKEWIHVDKVSSAFRNRVYLTWHQGNVMQFARSTTQPVSGGASLAFAPTISFTGEATGIGSDIATDRLGRVYYVYASLGTTAAIRLLRSDDGGQTFTDLNGATAGNAKIVYDLHGDFDFAVPAMETRRVFIYAAADVDNSGGPRDGRVYVAFTDENQAAGSPGGGNGTAAQSHGWIKVAYSDNQGADWTVVTPHSITDGATVDRFQPWIDVDGGGNVHVGWQDTRNSGAGLRNRADWYYAVSNDGGTTWIEETRVSDVTSENITNGQEWGDYNGVSVSSDGNVVGFTWTDNRIVSGAPLQRSFMGRVQNVVNGPSYNLSVSSADQTQTLCARTTPANAAPIDVSVAALNGFTSPVTLSLGTLPTGITGSIAPTSITAPGTAIANMSLGSTVAAGPNLFQINATGTQGASTVTRQLPITFNVFTLSPTAPSLTTPANNATNQAASLTLTWAAAPQTLQYKLELATDTNFTNIVRTVTTTATSETVSGLNSNTQYFWRVSAENPCASFPAGEFRNGFEDGGSTSGSAVSTSFSFTTAPAPGDCPVGTTAAVLFSQNFDAGTTLPSGWVTSVGTGTMTWNVASTFPFSLPNALQSVGTSAVGDVRIVTPTIAIPSTGAPRLVFQNKPGMEPRSAGGCWDAGLLEVSTNGGTSFTQITAGITGRGYTGAINAPNPAATLQGWCGAAGIASAVTAVDLVPYAGQNIQLRFRATSDDSVFVADGWNIDDVKVQTCN